MKPEDAGFTHVEFVSSHTPWAVELFSAGPLWWGWPLWTAADPVPSEATWRGSQRDHGTGAAAAHRPGWQQTCERKAEDRVGRGRHEEQQEKEGSSDREEEEEEELHEGGTMMRKDGWEEEEGIRTEERRENSALITVLCFQHKVKQSWSCLSWLIFSKKKKKDKEHRKHQAGSYWPQLTQPWPPPPSLWMCSVSSYGWKSADCLQTKQLWEAVCHGAVSLSCCYFLPLGIWGWESSEQAVYRTDNEPCPLCLY